MAARCAITTAPNRAEYEAIVAYHPQRGSDVAGAFALACDCLRLSHDTRDEIRRHFLVDSQAAKVLNLSGLRPGVGIWDSQTERCYSYTEGRADLSQQYYAGYLVWRTYDKSPLKYLDFLEQSRTYPELQDEHWGLPGSVVAQTHHTRVWRNKFWGCAPDDCAPEEESDG